MDVLVPIDGSECSFRALRFATGFARRYEATLHVVHITDVRGDDTEALLERASGVLAEEGIEDEPSVATDVRMSEARYATRVGKDILGMLDDEGYDHVIMGHHGEGAIGRIVIGSAAEAVVRGTDVPVTVVP